MDNALTEEPAALLAVSQSAYTRKDYAPAGLFQPCPPPLIALGRAIDRCALPLPSWKTGWQGGLGFYFGNPPHLDP